MLRDREERGKEMATPVFEVRENAAKIGQHAWVKFRGIRTFEDLQNLKTDYSGN
jgi:hypothetical protein